MNVQPVKRYQPPHYPNKEQVMHDQSLLLNLPQRWKYKASVCTAVSSLALLMLTACADIPSTQEFTTPTATFIPLDSATTAPSITPSQTPTPTIVTPDCYTSAPCIIPTPKVTPTQNETLTPSVTPGPSVSTSPIIKGIIYEPTTTTEAEAKQIIIDDINKQLTLSDASTTNQQDNYSFYTLEFSAKEETRKILRSQMADFAAYLKGQGII